MERQTISRTIMWQEPPSSAAVVVEDGITFTWANLNVSTIPQEGKRCCGLMKSKPKPEKKILSNVSGIARPGEVLAIMGASGAGKSTLLNTLLFRNLKGLQVRRNYVSIPTLLILKSYTLGNRFKNCQQDHSNSNKSNRSLRLRAARRSFHHYSDCKGTFNFPGKSKNG